MLFYDSNQIAALNYMLAIQYNLAFYFSMLLLLICLRGASHNPFKGI
nr:MAG TPA: hypothetical protein [Caudoviricetes sp.]